jgi:hypothetical protein
VYKTAARPELSYGPCGGRPGEDSYQQVRGPLVMKKITTEFTVSQINFFTVL